MIRTSDTWISYMNDDGLKVEGYFELIEQSINYIKIKTGQNIITIPYHKINKIKQRCENA